MPELNEPERVRVDRSRLHRAVDRRDRNVKEWSKNLEYFVGEQGIEYLVGSNDLAVTVNKIFAHVRAAVPALMFSNPYFNVTHVTSESDAEAKRAKEFILNHYWQRAWGEWAARMAVLSSQFAYGCIKVGFTPFFTANPKAGVIEYDDKGSPIIESILENGLKIPKLVSGDFAIGEDGGYLFDSDGVAIPEPGEILQDEDFFVDWVPWDRPILDPDGGNDFRNHAWIAEEWVLPTQDLKADKRFKLPKEFLGNETTLETRKASPIGVDTDSFMSSAPSNPDSESVRLDQSRTRGYTIYDFKKREVRWLVKGGDGKDEFYLRVTPLPPEHWDRGPFHCGPFVFLILNDVPMRAEGMPDIEPMRPIQDEINVQRSKMATHTRRADRHYIAEEGFIEREEEWDKLTKGGDMSIAIVKDLNGMRALEQAPMDASIGIAMQMVGADFDEVAGAGEMRGVASADTATQGAILENRQQIRESDRRENKIREFLIVTGSKYMRVIQANMTLPEYVKVADPKHRQPYLFAGTVDPADVDGDFLVSLDVGQLRPRTNPVYRQQVLSFMQQVFVPLATNPVGMRFMQPALMEELFEIFELGNTNVAREILATIEQTAAALDAQKQGGTPSAPQGAVGAISRDSGGGGQVVPLQARTQ